MGNRTGSALGTGRRQHVVRPGICTLFRISCGVQFIFQQQVLTVAGAPWLRGAGQRALADTPPPASTAGYLQPQRHSLGTACWRASHPTSCTGLGWAQDTRTGRCQAPQQSWCFRPVQDTPILLSNQGLCQPHSLGERDKLQPGYHLLQCCHCMAL